MKKTFSFENKTEQLVTKVTPEISKKFRELADEISIKPAALLRELVVSYCND